MVSASRSQLWLSRSYKNWLTSYKLSHLSLLVFDWSAEEYQKCGYDIPKNGIQLLKKRDMVVWDKFFDNKIEHPDVLGGRMLVDAMTVRMVRS